MSRSSTQFFPKDLPYLSYVDIWLPEDAPLSATREVGDGRRGDPPVARVVGHASEDGEARLVSVTTFVGGGGPRFWFSFAPEPRQTNYAQSS